MDETWVVDSSPFIVLAKLGELGLLTAFASKIVVPEQVAVEVLAGPADEASRALASGGFERRLVAVPNDIAAWGLGLGESAAIAAALELGTVLLVDDLAARRCARTLGLRVIGTLGVALRAKKQGLIPSATPLLMRLRDAGLYLDDEILAAALEALGEPWPPL